MSYPVGHLPPALPTGARDWLAHRKSKAKLSLVDLIEQIHLALLDNKQLGPEYLRLLYAVDKSQAVTGSVKGDHFKASDMIQQWAIKNGPPQVARANWVTIGRGLNWVLQRFEETSRKTRRKLIDGHAAPEGYTFDGSHDEAASAVNEE